jgi:hypothetical protein
MAPWPPTPSSQEHSTLVLDDTAATFLIRDLRSRLVSSTCGQSRRSVVFPSWVVKSNHSLVGQALHASRSRNTTELVMLGTAQQFRVPTGLIDQFSADYDPDKPSSGLRIRAPSKGCRWCVHHHCSLSITGRPISSRDSQVNRTSSNIGGSVFIVDLVTSMLVLLGLIKNHYSPLPSVMAVLLSALHSSRRVRWVYNAAQH